MKSFLSALQLSLVVTCIFIIIGGLFFAPETYGASLLVSFLGIWAALALLNKPWGI